MIRYTITQARTSVPSRPHWTPPRSSIPEVIPSTLLLEEGVRRSRRCCAHSQYSSTGLLLVLLLTTEVSLLPSRLKQSGLFQAFPAIPPGQPDMGDRSIRPIDTAKFQCSAQ